MSSAIGFPKLFDSDLDALLKMRGARFVSRAAELYCSVLIHYLEGNVESLTELVSVIQAESPASDDRDWHFLKKTSEARLRCRQFKITAGLISDLESLLAPPSLWTGEIAYVLSYAASIQGDHVRAKNAAMTSYRELKRVGARRKAVRALLNYVAEQSYIDPSQYYLSDLHLIYREARAVKDSTTIGLALQNLSRVHQSLGALSAAMGYADRAVAVLSKNAGNQAYYFALVHRAHLYAQQGCLKEASIDLELAAASEFPEIRSAIEVVQGSFPDLRVSQQVFREAEKISRLPNWRERDGEKASKALGKLEQQLLTLLSRNPQSKSEITQALYGTRLSEDVVSNRFANLLNRLRKRHPGLIVLVNGKYRLASGVISKKRNAS